MQVKERKYQERVGRFVYADANEKQSCREFKLNCIENSKFSDDLNNFLTLSADSFEFEQMIALNSRFSKVAVIDSYEFDAETYINGLPKYKQLKKKHQILNYKQGDIFNAEFEKYDVVDLDLCGSFTIDKLNNMVSAFQRFEKGFAFITMTKNVRNSSLLEYLDVFGAKDYAHFRDKVFKNYMGEMCGLKQYVRPYCYANKSKSAYAKEMITYVFTKNLKNNLHINFFIISFTS